MQAKILFALSVAAVFTLGSAAAEPMGPPEGAISVVPPGAVLAMTRASGFEPIGPPVRRGRVYWLQAMNPRGREVALIVDSGTGRILSVSPLGVPPLRYGPAAGYEPMDEPPPSYGRAYGEMSPYGRAGPYGYGQPAYGARRAPIDDDEELTPPGLMPNSRAATPYVDRSATVTTPRTPLPRARPAGAAITSAATNGPAITGSTNSAEPTKTPSQTVPTPPQNNAQDQREGTAAKPADLPPVTPLD